MRTERVNRIRCGGWLALAIALPGAALAGERFTPYVGAEAEYNSNIFYLDDGESALDANGNTRLDDLVRRYVAGFELNLPLGAQTLRAAFEGDRFAYEHFSELDHDEYHAGAGLDWQLTTSLAGTVDYHQEERMASFLDRDSTDLTLETESIGHATVNFLIAPAWRMEAGLRTRELDSPLPEDPEFRLTENAIDIAVKHAGAQLLSTGLYAQFLSGRYGGIADAGPFREATVGILVDYLIGALSHLAADLGYTKRDDGGGGFGAVTGRLEYHRELSGKTSMDLKGFRRVDSYVGGASAVVDTGVRAGLAWQATQKISLSATYEWSSSLFQESSPNQNRKDDGQLGAVDLAYRMRPWLTLRAYGGYQSRNSNVELRSFNAAIAGFNIEARF